MSKIIKQLQKERDKINTKIATLETERNKLDEAIMRLNGVEIIETPVEHHERVTHLAQTLAQSQIPHFLNKENTNE